MGNRREFLKGSGMLGIAALSSALPAQAQREIKKSSADSDSQTGADPRMPVSPNTTERTTTGSLEFEEAVERTLPTEKLYGFRETIVREFNRSWRDPAAKLQSNEIEITSHGWSVVYPSESGLVLKQAVEEFRTHLGTAMQVHIAAAQKPPLAPSLPTRNVIIVGTRDQIPGYGQALTAPKDYQIAVTPGKIVICGYDERGAMFGLYNLESRMELRGGPFLPSDLATVRHSLLRSRMVLSGLGWMDWPDWYLRLLPRYGFDSIYASCYANPNGALAPETEATIMHRQDPAKMHDLIRRAAKYGLSIYAPILYEIQGNASDEIALRKLVRDNVTEFPEIRGYVLLIEGFRQHTWPPRWHNNSDQFRSWIREWTRGVGIATDEFHKIKPEIDVLPWDYNIDNHPEAIDIKRFVIDQYPSGVMPLITWVNGKKFMRDGEVGYVGDYSISEVGPSEVAAAQIQEARKRGMKVYAKADTFVTWQYGTFPYLPVPYQWYARYQALEKDAIDGTMESWSYGFKPNFMAAVRAWYCWTDAPPIDDLLRQVARQKFGSGSEDAILASWKHFSQAIQLVPDTGGSMGTTNAIGCPLFFEKPQPRAMTVDHSWLDPKLWEQHSLISPYWPYAPRRLVLLPDFSNKVNVAERYARTFSLPVFNKYLLLAANQMEAGLKDYRKAALSAPSSKRYDAYREVLIAEQLQRMMRSDQAILEFEDLRYRLHHEANHDQQKQMLNRMTTILREEISRTESSLKMTERDSRLGYEWEQDYFYTPYVLKQKLEQLHEVLEKELPAFSPIT